MGNLSNTPSLNSIINKGDIFEGILVLFFKKVWGIFERILLASSIFLFNVSMRTSPSVEFICPKASIAIFVKTAGREAEKTWLNPESL